MTIERERRALALAEEALSLDAHGRAAWLAAQCGDDAALRAEVDAVLAADASDKGFLRPPTGQDVTHLLGRAPPALRPGTRVGSYVIEDVIARGGMGVVYAALQDRPHRKVALKVMSSGFSSRYAWRHFAFEAEALGRLRHTGIAQIFEAGTHKDGGTDVPFIAMEYIEGARTVVADARERRLKLGARLALMADVCDAIDHGHRRGVIHRDIKPGNILVDNQGVVKVIDFGIARSSGVDPGHTTLITEAGAIIGTLGYNSPEQLAGDPRDVDTRSDVYALGVVLYELVCGRKAFRLDGLALADAMLAVKRMVPPAPSSVHPKLPSEIDAIVARAMAKEPDDRYPSAAAMAADLRRVVRRQPLDAAPARGAVPGARERRVRWTMVGAFALLVALVIADRVRVGRSLQALRAAMVPADDAVARPALSVLDVLEDLVAQSRAPARPPDEARLLLEQGERLLGRVVLPEAEAAAARAVLAEGYRALGDDVRASALLSGGG